MFTLAAPFNVAIDRMQRGFKKVERRGAGE